MRCEEVQDQLSLYLEDELEPAGRRAIEDHLGKCDRCRQEMALLWRTIGVLQTLEAIEVPPHLTAAVEASVNAREASWWRRVASWLFYPLHIKIPLEAAALVLVAIGAVYLSRSAPEVAQAPRPSVSLESTRRDQPVPSVTGRGEMDESAARQRSSPEPQAQIGAQEEPEGLRDKLGAARALRKEAPAAAKTAPPLRELTLRPRDASRAVSRIAEIATGMGGTVTEPRSAERLVLTIPAEAYTKFLDALRDLGDLGPPPAEAPSPPPAAGITAETRSRPSSPGTVTLAIRLIP